MQNNQPGILLPPGSISPERQMVEVIRSLRVNIAVSIATRLACEQASDPLADADKIADWSVLNAEAIIRRLSVGPFALPVPSLKEQGPE